MGRERGGKVGPSSHFFKPEQTPVRQFKQNMRLTRPNRRQAKAVHAGPPCTLTKPVSLHGLLQANAALSHRYLVSAARKLGAMPRGVATRDGTQRATHFEKERLRFTALSNFYPSEALRTHALYTSVFYARQPR